MEGSTGVFYANCPLGGHGVYCRGEEMLTLGPCMLTTEPPALGHSLWTWITVSKERTALGFGFCLMLSSGRGSSCRMKTRGGQQEGAVPRARLAASVQPHSHDPLTPSSHLVAQQG